MKIEELERFARDENCKLIVLRGHGLCIYQRDAARLMGFGLRQFYDEKREGRAPAAVMHNARAWIPLSVLVEYL